MESKQSIWYIIINPHAGSGKTMSKWVPAERKLYAKGVEYRTAYTDHRYHATELAYKAAGKGYRKILAVGGDGSVHEAFAGIMKWCEENGADPLEFTLGVFPIGSGNDWIKTCRVPKKTEEVISLISEEHTINLDVIKLVNAQSNPSYMLNVGGMGFDSHVCKRVNIQKESGKRGRRIYLNALLHTVKDLQAINLKFISDGEEIFSGECYSIALGNGEYSGSGMRQVPGAKIDDGLIDYMICPKISVSTILKEIPKLLNGKIRQSKAELIFGRGRELEIIPLDSLSADIFEVDGEIEGRCPVKISFTGQQIKAIGG